LLNNTNYEIFIYNTIAIGKTFSVYPNPLKASQTLTVLVKATEASTQHIVVTDLLGRVVFTKQVLVNEGSNTILLQEAKLRTGTYLVKIGAKQVSKLVVE
jgi:hypothetical protein